MSGNESEDEGGEGCNEQDEDPFEQLSQETRDSAVRAATEAVFPHRDRTALLTAITSPISEMVAMQSESLADRVSVSAKDVIEAADSNALDVDEMISPETVLSNRPNHTTTLGGVDMELESKDPMMDPPPTPEPRQKRTEDRSPEEILDEIVGELIDIGFIIQCDRCSKRVLAENSHRFATNENGETACGACRSTGRSFG